MEKGKLHTHTHIQACTSYIKWHTRQANKNNNQWFCMAVVDTCRCSTEEDVHLRLHLSQKAMVGVCAVM